MREQETSKREQEKKLKKISDKVETLKKAVKYMSDEDENLKEKRKNYMKVMETVEKRTNDIEEITGVTEVIVIGSSSDPME